MAYENKDEDGDVRSVLIRLHQGDSVDKVMSCCQRCRSALSKILTRPEFDLSFLRVRGHVG